MPFAQRAWRLNRPLIYMGFGSVPLADPDSACKLLVDTVKLAGVCAVISKGWAALSGGCDDDVPERDPDFDGVRRPDSPPLVPLNRSVVEDELERLAESLCRDQRGRPLEIIDFRWRECCRNDYAAALGTP